MTRFTAFRQIDLDIVGEEKHEFWGNIYFAVLNVGLGVTMAHYCIREGFKNPRHGNFPLLGYPPPGASTDKIFPKS